MQNLRNPNHGSNPAEAEARFEAEGAPLYRIGAVAKLAGVPVTTLRVWETRYGAFAPAKSSGRHRLYAEADVARARLLRQLTGSGHSVGAIAALPTAELQAMQANLRPARPAPLPDQASRGAVAVVVVGAALATRLDSPAWQQMAGGLHLHVRHVFADLAAALAEGQPLAGEPGTGLLLVRVNVVHAAVYEQLAQLLAQLQAGRAILVYSYGAEPVLASLRAAGMLLRREPVTDDELAQLVRGLVVMDPGQAVPAMPAGGMIPPRRFSDAQLAQVAAAPNRVLCECPRHIAELITQLASFEDYSAQCLNDSEEDARLHAYLRSISGSARALFEHALVKVAHHGGIELAQRP
ncbi:MAG TPA: MerR family transcriptional regulator [Ramlibacter sp.]|nr:MerR family transcriptional regulator [Ramlibacter sp.]